MLATLELCLLAAISSRFRNLRFSRLILRLFLRARITVAGWASEIIWNLSGSENQVHPVPNIWSQAHTQVTAKNANTPTSITH